MRSAAPVRHLILGGTGFIGRALALRLAGDGHAVTVASRRAPDPALAASCSITWRQFDLHAPAWDGLLDGVATVFHLAWTSLPATAAADPPGDLVRNVLPSLGLLEALRRRGKAAPRLVFASSGGTVYGPPGQVPVPEHHPLRPLTAYGAAKAAVELYAGQYRALYGLDCRIARLANPFGAGQDPARGQGAATAFARHALAGRPVQIWGDGAVVRDYIHISDAVSGLVALSAAPRWEGPAVFNIGSGQGTSLNGIVQALEQALGRSLCVERSAGRGFDVPVSILDVQQAKDRLGWRPRLSLAAGLGRMIAALQQDGRPAAWCQD